MSADLTQPPHTPLYFHLSADKWDMDYQRNALLHFVESKGLSGECLTWLNENTPAGWFRSED